VRERRDVDLILDKGMLSTGWHAHTLDAPGKFYVLADGLNNPRRARAYLVTDDDVSATVAQHATARPTLDPLSADAIDRDAEPDHDVIDGEVIEETDPELTLWTALRDAPDNGLSVPELMRLTGMRRTWIYDRLQAHANADRAQQVSRGRWRATEVHRHAT
jgi:S-DNA-T family DNA segregation ATPase FtsK/SpoIIIE